MTEDREHFIGVVALAVLVCVQLGHVVARARRTPATPDPWDKEIEKSLHEPEAVEVCHRCFNPITPNSWFCTHCGCAVGPYNNLMPYLNYFSQGEVLRNGVNDKLRQNALIISGYLLVSLNLYMIFAPIYWILFFRNLQQQKDSAQQTETHYDQGPERNI